MELQYTLNQEHTSHPNAPAWTWAVCLHKYWSTKLYIFSHSHLGLSWRQSSLRVLWCFLKIYLYPIGFWNTSVLYRWMWPTASAKACPHEHCQCVERDWCVCVCVWERESVCVCMCVEKSHEWMCTGLHVYNVYTIKQPMSMISKVIPQHALGTYICEV